ncbi:MAG TPA: beta-ketoacyl-[acyl-carrier-protein] synthase family protein [Hyphomicrobiaceae bacterium]|nr:beta-ketoacyl-[acyl-carrier-protein] synthase family protein [Hyphomicrobiaceae bacterium]
MQVAITGAGVVSSIGIGRQAFLDNVYAGRTRIAAPPWDHRPEFDGVWISNIVDFDPLAFMPAKVAEGTDRFGQYLLAAATEAVRSAGYEAPPVPDRTAVVCCTALGSVHTIAGSQHGLDTIGPDGISSKFHIRAWPNMGAAQIALRWKLHGPLLTVATACASSLDAIAQAARMVESGQADMAIAGGADASMTELRVLSGARYGMFKPVADSTKASRPFDRDRTGAVLGEGSAIVVLERLADAEKRGANILGVVRGAASLSDAYHVSSPGPDGTWQAETMRRAISEASLPGGVSSVDAVIAHATATPVGDLAEARAIHRVFGDDAPPVRVTSLKGHTGHPAGGAGGMGLVAGLEAMQRGHVPPVAGTTVLDPEIRFRVPTFAQNGDDGGGPVAAIAVNAFGFGGQNACLVVTRH